MKKILLSMIALIALFVFVGCKSVETPANTKEVLQGTKEVYGFQAMSSITLLDSMSTSTTAPVLASSSVNYSYSRLSTTEEVTEEEIDQINKYLGIMEQMLADDEPISVVDETSDLVEYAHKMVISTKDLNLNTYTYVLYYNEVALSDLADEENEEEENEVEEPTEEEENEAVENEEEETESSLEGIMVVGDQEYTVYGKKELEEDEMKVEFTSQLDEQNWVTVEQKTENNETKFEYTISENGVISTTEMKFEQEENETKLSLEFEQGEVEREYEFKKEIEEDGKEVIKIEINDGTTQFEVKVFVVVDPETGETSYEYRLKDSDKSFNKDRENPHDDDDEKEDEEEENEVEEPEEDEVEEPETEEELEETTPEVVDQA